MSSRHTTDHHEDLAHAFTSRHEMLISAVRDGVNFTRTRDLLVTFIREEVFPHMRSEEALLYQVARQNGLAELADAMELDHDAQVELVTMIDQAQTGFDAARASRAFGTLLFLRIAKEERILIPALDKAGVDLEQLLEGVPEITGT